MTLLGDFMDEVSKKQANETMDVEPIVRARTLLTYLWRAYDAGGISVGRSHEAVLLEAAMDLMGPVDVIDVGRDYGVNINEARNYISAQKRKEYGLDGFEWPPR